MPQAPPDLSLLELRPGELLLLLGLEFHVRIVLGARVGCRYRGAADGAADIAGTGPRVLESI